MLNYDVSLEATLQAMLVENSVQVSVVWNSETKDFIGIISVRDILDMVVFFAEILNQTLNQTDAANMKQQEFVEYLLSKNFIERKDKPLRKLRDTYFIPKLSSLPLILHQITLADWLKHKEKAGKSKSSLVELNYDDKVVKCLEIMAKEGYSTIALLN